MPGRNIAMSRNHVFSAILASKCLILGKFISREPVVGWVSLTPHSKQKHQFPIRVSYNVYHFSERIWLNLAFWLKMAEEGNFAYLQNHWSNDNGWPLILIGRHVFLLEIPRRNDILHILDGWSSHFGLKKTNSRKIHISRTSGRMSFVDPSTEWKTLIVYLCFI